jgi:lipid A 3-O-deacylase
VVNVRIDNDLFGGMGQDRGYSNGFELTLMSSNLQDVQHPECLPALIRGLNNYLDWLREISGSDQDWTHKNVVVGLGQAIYTPSNKTATALLPNDRPYAAALLLNLGYNARMNDYLRTSHLYVGAVGPVALGEQVQNNWHKLIGVTPFEGWNNQLHNEPVAMLVHERLWRWASAPSPSGWGWDAINHVGGALGNLATYANTGTELRLGWHVPDDFGSDPLRPAGQNNAPARASQGAQGWSGHVFVSLDTKVVAHDLTLDGNTFVDSHSVKKIPLVADVGHGMAITYSGWKFAFARHKRTREFYGQEQRPAFGSFTISWQRDLGD